jgi:hypothetical protein
MPRLRKAGRTITILATLFVIAFLYAYARSYIRYGNRHPQTTASVTTPTQQRFFTPTHTRASHRRHTFFRPAHQANRRQRRTNPYYLTSMRRLRRLVSQLLVVRS